MKNTNIKQIAFITVMGLFLSACGGSSSSTTTIAVVETKLPSCGTATDKGKAVAKDVTGKTIKKVGDGAEVRIWHSPDDSTKLACMINGAAIIVDN